jgi:POT family proton-dependent oligopeptide transporter
VDIPPDLMPSLEDVFCLILILFSDRLVYPLLERCGTRVLALRKIAFGFFFIALSFLLAGFVQLLINASSTPISVAWQVPQIFLMGCAEITVSEHVLNV